MIKMILQLYIYAWRKKNYIFAHTWMTKKTAVSIIKGCIYVLYGSKGIYYVWERVNGRLQLGFHT